MGAIYNDRPEVINLGVLRLQRECPASDGPGTALPRALLDRWIATADACISWHNGTELDDIIREQFGAFDLVQRDICTSLLRRYVDLMGNRRHDAVDLEGAWINIPHPDPTTNAMVGAKYQWTLEGEAGSELIKLRTGRYGSTPEETSVLLSGRDPEDSIVEVMLAPGTVEVLEMDPQTQASTLQGVYDFWDETRSAEWQANRRTPGFACYGFCNRPARCGQYPTDGRIIGGNTRTVRVSKTSALELRDCHRRVAWKAVYQIPTDEGDDYDEAREWGRDFHALYAAALLQPDPTSAYKEAVLAVADDDEAQRLNRLWDRHLEIEAAHESPITYRETEYAVGVTMETTGLAAYKREVVAGRPVAVVYIARADAVGRESDGTPAVVEIRTGAAIRETSQLELDIYALGAARLVNSDRVAVHLHRLGPADGPTCHRELYGPEQLSHAAQRLEDPTKTVASWDPHNTLHPSYTVDAWCSDCAFRSRCENYRGDHASSSF